MVVSTLLGFALPSIVTSVKLSLCRFRDICDSSAVKLLSVARISFIRSSRIRSLQGRYQYRKKAGKFANYGRNNFF